MIDDEGTWDLSAAGVLRLPSGRLLRGRGLRQPVPDDTLPQFALYLQGKTPPVGRPSRWVHWPAWRSSTALHPGRQSPTSASTTTNGPSRLPGSAATSSASSHSGTRTVARLPIDLWDSTGDNPRRGTHEAPRSDTAITSQEARVRRMGS